MPAYRLYLLDSFSGHINAVEDIYSADDLGAIALVTEQPRDVPAELWCEGRKVCRFDALPEISKYVRPRGTREASAPSAVPLRPASPGAPAHG